ncbi:MAG: 50S ribosomal protein L4 [Minisyncoccia bacterium]
MATLKKSVSKKAPAKKAVKKASAPRTKKEPVSEAGTASASLTKGRNEAIIYDMKGAKAGVAALPAELFEAKWNADLVHQVVIGMQANKRENSAHTKFRSEVRGGGKKPWKQKGTGRARHGSTRSPIWRKGGISHGPRAERDYSVKINKKARSAALVALLSRKLRDGELILVDTLSFSKPATKEARGALVAIGKGAGHTMLSEKRTNAAVIALSSKNANTEKSFRNIGSLETVEIRNLNPVDLVTKKYLVIENPTESFAVLTSRLTK